MLLTGLWKWKWWRTARVMRLTNNAAPSVWHKHRSTLGFLLVFFCNRTLTTAYKREVDQWSLVPSSTTIAKFPSGERPTHVMFFVVETGNVSDVLLEDREEENSFMHHAVQSPSLSFFSDLQVGVLHSKPGLKPLHIRALTSLIMTYFFRSKTETLFPTGLTTALPSLEKFKFPWR